MIKLQKIEKQHIKYIALAAAILVVLVVIFAAIALNSNSNQQPIKDWEYGENEEGDDKYLNIKNYYQLSQTYGYQGAAAIKKQLTDIVFTESELAAATKGAVTEDGYKYHYKTTLIESSFTLYNLDPEIYTFRFDVSDGRTYQVYIRPCEDAAVDRCYSTVAVRDGVVNFVTAAVSEDAVAEAENWKNQF